MYLPQIAQRVLFQGRVRPGFHFFLERFLLTAQGARIGAGTHFSNLHANWPNQLSIGRDSLLQEKVCFDYCHGEPLPGPNIVIGDRVFIGRYCEFNLRSGISIGDDCLIASGCKFIDHDHDVRRGAPMNRREGPESAIALESDVWLGVNVVVLKGVKIGRGAVVGAGAVVTRSVPEFEIWGGVPARKLGDRPTAAAAPDLMPADAAASYRGSA